MMTPQQGIIFCIIDLSWGIHWPPYRNLFNQAQRCPSSGHVYVRDRQFEPLCAKYIFVHNDEGMRALYCFWFVISMLYLKVTSLIARFMGPTRGPSGADRWAPYLPHELCYLGLYFNVFGCFFTSDVRVVITHTSGTKPIIKVNTSVPADRILES